MSRDMVGKGTEVRVLTEVLVVMVQSREVGSLLGL